MAVPASEMQANSASTMKDVVRITDLFGLDPYNLDVNALAKEALNDLQTGDYLKRTPQVPGKSPSMTDVKSAVFSNKANNTESKASEQNSAAQSVQSTSTMFRR